MSPTAQLLGATRNSRSRMVRISTAERRRSSRRAVRNVVRGLRGELNSVSADALEDGPLLQQCDAAEVPGTPHCEAEPPQHEREHRRNHAVDLDRAAKEEPPSPRVGRRQIHDVGDEADRETQIDHSRTPPWRFVPARRLARPMVHSEYARGRSRKT
mgnify:CR=1 FL=1